ncbi:hypothetical protein PTTG_02252 [Puccinia triticina 1-1 BBBD Race 1]|uniref:Uncharacterized protein n=1 Tax=Puccinia triticina (isolate 1-1 / race 1 (BBBD)) TaxID=630390 RepID=A0A180G5E6_PUCT1|nr:hypothetical protein PTTG_02252 [Puccinia triticina 1-1 BBBD Race 1]
MPSRQINNPSPLIPSVPVLDGNSVTFPAWRSRLQNVLTIQGVIDIVNKSLPRPNNTDTKDGKSLVRSPEQRGYNPEDYGADWDTLSDMAISTISLTLSASNRLISFSRQSVMHTRRTPGPDVFSLKMRSGQPVKIPLSLLLNGSLRFVLPPPTSPV